MTSLLRSTHAPLPCLAALVISSTLAGCSGDAVAPDAGRDASEPLDAVSALDTGGEGPDAFSALDAPVECDDNCSPSFDAGSSDAPRLDAALMGNAFIARTCGPADGFALSLIISDFLDASMCTADPLRASTQFFVHDLGGASLPPTPGATITSTPDASNGSATQCPGGSPPCRISEAWSLTFATYSDTGGATGQYTITWIGGETSTGSFLATRCEMGPIVCG